MHIGPEVKKETEEEDVGCEDDILLACQPENPLKALDFDVSENQTGIVLLTSFFWGKWDGNMNCFEYGLEI